MPAASRIPIFRNDRYSEDAESGLQPRESPGERAVFGAWYREHRPDVIIGSSPVVLAMIGQMRLVVPRDVAYVDLCLEGADYGIAGVRQNGEIAGEVATRCWWASCSTAARGSSARARPIISRAASGWSSRSSATANP